MTANLPAAAATASAPTLSLRFRSIDATAGSFSDAEATVQLQPQFFHIVSNNICPEAHRRISATQLYTATACAPTAPATSGRQLRKRPFNSTGLSSLSPPASALEIRLIRNSSSIHGAAS